jgi:hypothetical protein
MSDVDDLIKELGEIQKQLAELPEDANDERFRLRQRQDELRALAREHAGDLDKDRPTSEMLYELDALRAQMKAVESQRIDLVQQAGSGGAASGEMGNLGGVKINKGIDDAQGLPGIKARIGRLKGILRDRGVDIPPVD